MTGKITAAIAVVAFLAGCLVAGIAQGWRYEAKLSRQTGAHATELKIISDKAAAQRDQALADQQAMQDKAQAADQKHIQELTNEQAENERLRRLYAGANANADALRQRLRIQAKCPAPAASGSLPAPAGAGSLGDATSVELSDAAGQDVFDIRRGIIEDQRKLAYLQEYARTCSGQP
jgi:prophage endopeptidase